jgi:hypothetical protein
VSLAWIAIALPFSIRSMLNTDPAMSRVRLHKRLIRLAFYAELADAVAPPG